eukprot:15345482-Ditylum_brightwellii.AAC.1
MEIDQTYWEDRDYSTNSNLDFIFELAESYTTCNKHAVDSPKTNDNPPSFIKGDWVGMMNNVKEIMSKKCKALRKAKFDFEWLLGVARKNSNLLQKYGFDITSAIVANKGSTMDYGPEFRPADDIDRILCHYKFWGQINVSLTQGVKYPMKKLSEKERITTL